MAKLHRKQTKVCPFPPRNPISRRKTQKYSEWITQPALISKQNGAPTKLSHHSPQVSPERTHNHSAHQTLQPPWRAHPEETQDTGLRQLRSISEE